MPSIFAFYTKFSSTNPLYIWSHSSYVCLILLNQASLKSEAFETAFIKRKIFKGDKWKYNKIKRTRISKLFHPVAKSKRVNIKPN